MHLFDIYGKILYLITVSLSARQSIEIFHLVFLRALVAKGEDKRFFALKGGCNLRFFFRSVRYSEDIDLDVSVVAKDTLKNKVEKLLRSPVVVVSLRTYGIELIETSAPKQTETTQRWKVGLRVDGLGLPLRTKIEFSRRSATSGAAFEAVDREVLQPYALTPFLANHYTTASAIAQKIHALSNRREPQARDVFDLNLLFARPEAEKLAFSNKEKGWLRGAIDHALNISFDDYAGGVVAFLDPAQSELFSDRSAWEVMQAFVLERLEALA